MCSSSSAWPMLRNLLVDVRLTLHFNEYAKQIRFVLVWSWNLQNFLLDQNYFRINTRSFIIAIIYLLATIYCDLDDGRIDKLKLICKEELTMIWCISPCRSMKLSIFHKHSSWNFLVSKTIQVYGRLIGCVRHGNPTICFRLLDG